MLLFFHGAFGSVILRGAFITYYVLFITWCLVFVHWNFPARTQELAHSQEYWHSSSVLFPIHCVLLLLLIAFVLWSNHQVDAQKKRMAQLQIEGLKVDRLRAFGIIAAGFTHQFSTPLATLRLKLNRLKDKEHFFADEDFQIACEAAQNAEKSLRVLLGQRFKDQKIDFCDFNLSAHCLHIVDSWKQDKNCEVICELSSDLWVRGPLLSFTQMIVDLLENSLNAIQAIALQQGNGQIFVKSNEAQDTVELRIEDNGCGFPAWVIESIGTPFVSASPGGTGLGMYHAFELCKAMGGALTARNTSIEKERESGSVTLSFARVQKET
jgi:signal transduction histidine kinase